MSNGTVGEFKAKLLRAQIKWTMDKPVPSETYYIIRNMICMTFDISKSLYNDIKQDISEKGE